jgi:hypothetical protein
MVQPTLNGSAKSTHALHPRTHAAVPDLEYAVNMDIEIASLMWLLPVVFMVHDFEEIIMLQPWLTREAERFPKRFPGVAKRVLLHLSHLSTPAFALAVAEEFVVLSAITLLAVVGGLFALWAGIVLAFFIHLVAHGIQFIVYGRYVPAIATSILVGPLCLAGLAYLNTKHPLDWPEVALWTAIALVVMLGNVILAHALAARFQAWLHGTHGVGP